MSTIVVGEIAFLGAEIARSLRNNHSEDVVLYGPARSDSLPAGIPAVVGEVASHANLGSVIYKYKPTTLIYVPTKARDVHGTYAEAEDFKQLTASAASLVSLTASFNIPSVTMVSSYEVFGRVSGRKKPASPQPTTLRGKALVLLESVLLGLPSGCVVRLGEVFGAAPYAGATAVNSIVESLALANRVGIIDSDRCLDVYPVEHAGSIAAYVALHYGPGVFNLGAHKPTRLVDFAKRTAERCGLSKGSVISSKRGILPNAALPLDIPAHEADNMAYVDTMIERLRSQ